VAVVAYGVYLLFESLGSELEARHRADIPILVGLLSDWKTIKSIIPDGLVTTFEILLEDFQENNVFTVGQQRLIGNIFEQLLGK
jgi:hypothetical protein